MYTYSYYDRQNSWLHLFDDNEGYQTFPYIPTCYKKVNEVTELKSIFGDYVKEVPIKSLNEYDRSFQRDVNPAYKFLIDCYYDDETIPKYDVAYLDIETDSEDGFPNMETYDKQIWSIAIRYQHKNYVFVLDKFHKFSLSNTEENTFFVFFTEFEMLTAFFDYFHELRPTIVSTYYGNDFDIPYILGRGRKIVGKKVNLLSPCGIIEDYVNKKERRIIKIVGVSHIDYLVLYKKFAESKRDSYTLDNISEYELHEHKLEYTGTLAELYRDDINQFIKYNIQDVVLLDKLEKKLNYIQIAVNICVKGKVNFEDVMYPSLIIDGAIMAYMKQKNLVAPSKYQDTDVDFDETEAVEKATGAYVKLPIAGLYSWIVDLDATSMYPSIIRSLNISPETKFGRLMDWWKTHLHAYIRYKKTGEGGDTKVTLDNMNADYEIQYSDIESICKEFNLLLASNGALYKQDFRGIIPTILDQWFNERQTYKTLSKKYFKEADTYELNSPKNIELRTLAEEYDIKQYRIKILLNTTFGVLLNKGFRYYDQDNGEAITISGQEIIQFSQDRINDYLSEKLGKKDDFVLYIDTDSVGKDSVINTNKYGLITIENLFNELKNDINSINFNDVLGKEYVINNEIKTEFLDTDKIDLGHIEYINKHLVKKRMFKIKTKAGKFVEITEDHSIMVLVDGNLIEKKPCDLLKGDKIISIIRQ